MDQPTKKQALKVLSLRTHLLPDDAAQFLSLAVGTTLQVRDLWDLVLHERLSLSLEFLEPGHARRGKLVPESKNKKLRASLPNYTGFGFDTPPDLSVNSREVDRYFISGWQIEETDTGVRHFDGDSLLVLEGEPQEVRGVWDLVLAGDGRNFVNSLLEVELGRPRLEMSRASGTLLQKSGEDGYVWELLEAADDGRLCTCIGIPATCRPVFHLSELQQFADEKLHSTAEDEHLGAMNLRTALRILGAVLEHTDPVEKRMIEEIDELKLHGCSKRNLQTYLPAAKRALNEARKSQK